jgi:spore maturation protein CgeB
MKIMLLGQYYDSYVRYFYLNHPNVANRSYEQQWRAFMADCPSWLLYLIPHFQDLGSEATALFVNAKPIQRAWARENDYPFDEHTWPFSIAREQIRRFRPDILWIDSDRYLGSFLREVKHNCGAVFVWKASEYSSTLDWSDVDCVLSTHSPLIHKFLQLGLKCEVMHPCFEPRILDSLPEACRELDITFTGGLHSGSKGAFRQRLSMLTHLQKHFPLQVYAMKPRWQRRPWPLGSFLAQARDLQLFYRLHRYEAVYGLRMFALLRRTRIAVNIHTAMAEGYAGNQRMFEATGAGALLLTEAAPNLAQLFEPEKEVATYSCKDEAIEKIHYLLHHETERACIASAGQARTLRDHNAAVRAAQFLEIAAKFNG